MVLRGGEDQWVAQPSSQDTQPHSHNLSPTVSLFLGYFNIYLEQSFHPGAGLSYEHVKMNSFRELEMHAWKVPDSTAVNSVVSPVMETTLGAGGGRPTSA